ncbi:MAG TPA: tripartite tricarboxylate transporter TctB family protein [Limnochordales bacterium]
MKRKHVEQIIFMVLVGAVFAYVAITSQGFVRTARIFPQVIATAMLILTIAEIISYWRAVQREAREGEGPHGPVEEPGPSLTDGFKEVWPYLIWIGAYFVAIYLVGFVVASAVFVALSVWLMGRMRWYWAFGSTAVLIVGLMVMAQALSLSWPMGVWFTWP